MLLRRWDAPTADHCDRVGILAESMGWKLGMTAPEVQRLGIAGRLHDVGKLYISPTLLNKLSTLTESEREIVREHTRLGALILRDRAWDSVRDVVLHHHERLDGSGYPDGLLGAAISSDVRIIAVADSFDAMRVGRGYSEPREVGAAVDELRQQHLYDQSVVGALTRIVFPFLRGEPGRML